MAVWRVAWVYSSHGVCLSSSADPMTEFVDPGVSAENVLMNLVNHRTKAVLERVMGFLQQVPRAGPPTDEKGVCSGCVVVLLAERGV